MIAKTYARQSMTSIKAISVFREDKKEQGKCMWHSHKNTLIDGFHQICDRLVVLFSTKLLQIQDDTFAYLKAKHRTMSIEHFSK